MANMICDIIRSQYTLKKGGESTASEVIITLLKASHMQKSEEQSSIVAS